MKLVDNLRPISVPAAVLAWTFSTIVFIVLPLTLFALCVAIIRWFWLTAT